MIDLIYPARTAPVVRGSLKASACEMLPIVDEHGNVTAQASRKYCHGGSKLLHPVVHLHVVSRDARIYLQQRSATKDLLPLRWDTAVGGHVTYGEYILEALYREAGEELGLSDFNPCFLTAYVFESESEKELVNVFAAVGEYELKPDGEEVIDGRYWSQNEIASTIGKGVLTPNFEQEYLRIQKSIQSLL